MTIPTFSERECIQNPDAANRAREPGVPAFLKPTPQAHYLPALLTILQSIPMAKEALLARDLELPDYGANSDWWDGNPIQTSKVVFVDIPSADSEYADLIFETQRLMAFLEQTDRAYGSVQNLLHAKAVRDGGNRPAADFLKAWQDAMKEARPNDPLNEIFTSTAVNDPLEAAKGQPQTAPLTEFQIPVTQQVLDLGGTLYDALDEMVWPEDEGDDVPSVHVQVGEILVARVTSNCQDVVGIGLDVPASFYPDRYFESSISAVQQMRAERISLLSTINQVSQMQAKLSLVENPSDAAKPISGIALVDKAKEYFARTGQKESIARSTGGDEMLVDIETGSGLFTYGTVADELQHVLEEVAVKHSALEQAKQSAKQRVREVTRSYREPNTHPDSTNLHRYTLRGASTDPSVVYVLANPNTTEDLLDTAQDDWQWWRLSYDQSSDHPVRSERVEQAEVLRAAKGDSDEVLLVYASDNAVAYPTEPISSRLRNFVRTDNLAFTRELEQASRRSTPTKRKASAMNEEWLNWDDAEDGRRTPVNIIVSDDEEWDEPPGYDSAVADRTSSPRTQEDANPDNWHGDTDHEAIKFPAYEDIEPLMLDSGDQGTEQDARDATREGSEAASSTTVVAVTGPQSTHVEDIRMEDGGPSAAKGS